MKKNVLLSSIITIVICLSLIVGSTFAYFSSSHEFNVAVTSANVKINATIENVEVWSYDADAKASVVVDTLTDVDNEGSFTNTGIVTLTGNEFTINRMTPGDKITFNIVVENTSDVTVQYRVTWKFNNDSLVIDNDDADDVYFSDALVITASEGGRDAQAWNAWSAPVTDDNGDVIDGTRTITVSVELPIIIGNDYQNKGVSIAITVEAVQGNVVDANGDLPQ